MEKELIKIFERTFLDLPEKKEDWDVMNIEGWDSLGHYSLMVEIEDVFQIHIPEEDYLLCTSYQNILDEIQKLGGVQ